MNMQEEQEIAHRNCQKAIATIPAALVKREATLAARLAASRLSPLKKLAAIYELLDDMGKHMAFATHCKRGCSNCCHYAVTVSEIEVQYIEQFAKKRRMVPVGAAGNWLGTPCPFLKGNACSIYEARPFVCRRHHSFAPSDTWCHPAKAFEGDFAKAHSSEAETAYDQLREKGPGSLLDIRQVFSG